jgi:hypothetical protein
LRDGRLHEGEAVSSSGKVRDPTLDNVNLGEERFRVKDGKPNTTQNTGTNVKPYK